MFLSTSPGLKIGATELADDVHDPFALLLVFPFELSCAVQIRDHGIRLVPEQIFPIFGIVVATLAVFMDVGILFVFLHLLLIGKALIACLVCAFDGDSHV